MQGVNTNYSKHGLSLGGTTACTLSTYNINYANKKNVIDGELN